MDSHHLHISGPAKTMKALGILWMTDQGFDFAWLAKYDPQECFGLSALPRVIDPDSDGLRIMRDGRHALTVGFTAPEVPEALYARLQVILPDCTIRATGTHQGRRYFFNRGEDLLAPDADADATTAQAA